MEGVRLLQLYLLSQMRAPGLVRGALEELGANDGELKIARHEIERYGLDAPGHPMNVYSTLLGSPLAVERAPESQPYREVGFHFALPLWPDIRFTVWGSSHGQTGAVGFTSPLGVPALGMLRVDQLAPWHMVEAQLASTLQNGTVTDDWYPQKDFECMLAGRNDSAMTRYILRFDFNLLQEVRPA